MSTNLVQSLGPAVIFQHDLGTSCAIRTRSPGTWEVKKNTIQASEEKTHSSSAVLSCDILPENVVILVRTVEFQLKPRQQILNHDV